MWLVVVSMFYMVAYGFINLSYVLENWASPDFRPSFRIPGWIGIIGFIASFAIMFKLDALAMTIAILLMFLCISLKRPLNSIMAMCGKAYGRQL